MENDLLTQKIIGTAIEVHRTLGPGLLESIYEEALFHEFDLRGICYRRQVEIDVIYKDKVIKGQRNDILVKEEVIVEIKSLSKLPRSLNGTDAFLSKGNWFEACTSNKLWRKNAPQRNKAHISVNSVFSVAK